jgi:hypothetical protein
MTRIGWVIDVLWRGCMAFVAVCLAAALVGPR